MAVKKNLPAGEISATDSGRGTLFARELLRWNELENDRQLPWKGEKDPYRIWLSEIILQQTRAEQGLKYYENFISAYPRITDLAADSDESVFKRWEGLGYYSRCRNLLATARHIATAHGGVFPADYESILSLKGVGPYTAAAIASFAYNLPHAVLDGNVYRVLARIFAIDTPTDSTAGKKQFATLAQAILPRESAGAYNQAIMDFGATVCKPLPKCGSCFFRQHCAAFQLGLQDVLPVKEKKIRTKERWFYYLVVRQGDRLLIRQRATKDIWQDLFEFVLFEESGPGKEQVVLDAFRQQYGVDLQLRGLPQSGRQKLTHQTVYFIFQEGALEAPVPVPGYRWVPLAEAAHYAFPKTLQQYLSTGLIG